MWPAGCPAGWPAGGPAGSQWQRTRALDACQGPAEPPSHPAPPAPTAPAPAPRAGNSGGPLLDSGGAMIGINTAIYSPSGDRAWRVQLSFSFSCGCVGRSVASTPPSTRLQVAVLGRSSHRCRYRAVVLVGPWHRHRHPLALAWPAAAADARRCWAPGRRAPSAAAARAARRRAGPARRPARPPSPPHWPAQPGSSAGVGFAIPVDVVKSSVEQVGGAAGWRGSAAGGAARRGRGGRAHGSPPPAGRMRALAGRRPLPQPQHGASGAARRRGPPNRLS